MKNTFDESTRCLLCLDAPCSVACKRTGTDPARGIRALRFEDARGAGTFFNKETCAGCDAPCQKACIHPDFPLRIREMAETFEARQQSERPSLEMDFCGIRCENPFFLASSVIASNYEMIAKALKMGWAGVMYKTISFAEIKEVSPRFDHVKKGSTAFIGFRNMEQLSVNTPEEDFAILSRLKKDFPTKVIVASIMGSNDEEWAQLARMSEEAGCDMVECNFSCPHMAEKGRGSDVGQKPELVRHFTEVVRAATKLPVIAKMTPNITHIEEPSIAAKEGGADAIAAINTIKSITMTHRSEVSGKSTISGYSGKAVKPIAQRFILDMRKDAQLSEIPISGIGGIETWKDALQYIMLGCNNVQVCTAVMQYGYRIIDDLILGMQTWMADEGVSVLEEVRGKAIDSYVHTDEMDRNTYILPHFDREKCIGCGRCYLSCYDGGHQAIQFETQDTGEKKAERRPHLIGKKCVGCHLCMLVCPADAIKASKRIPVQQRH